MASGSIVSESVWLATADVPETPALHGDTTADVCIVGAGIAGMNLAYLLGRKGKKVVVLDDGPIAHGQTCMTTAHLSNALDDRYVEVERIHGEETSRLAAESHTAAINHYDRIVHDERIACEFQRLDGFLFPHEAEAAELIEREFEAARRAGLMVERVNRLPLASHEAGPAIRFPAQGMFHPLKYLAALVEAIRRDGGRIYGSTHAQTIEGGERARVETRDGPVVTAAAVVVATNSPVNDRVAIHTKQAPYMTYVIGYRIPKGSVPRALYWDTLDPYHYVRLQADATAPDQYELLIVGGEDHKTGQAQDGEARFARLEQWTRDRFPQAYSVEFHWSGQVMETLDGLAFIGQNPMDADNVFIATGDSGMGMTHGMIAGLLLSELILGADHPWRPIYDPSRKPVKTLGEFAKENLNVAAEYGAWLTGGDVSSEEAIAPGTGAVIRYGLRKAAVYRDDQGKLTRLSAVCPHLKCIVAWNDVESTWDCPCHGSRFQACGEVMNGPANSNLPEFELNESEPDSGDPSDNEE